MSTRMAPARRAVFACIVLSLAFPAGAAMERAAGPQESQPTVPRPQTGRRDRSVDPAARAPELRDETFRLMDAYVISNIQESLGLSDEQFTRVLPLVKKLHSERRDFARRRMEALRSLRRALKSGSATESSVADLLKEVKMAGLDERAGATKNSEALDAALTPMQQAKYRVFEAEVELRLRHLQARSEARDRQTPR